MLLARAGKRNYEEYSTQRTIEELCVEIEIETLTLIPNSNFTKSNPDPDPNQGPYLMCGEKN